MRRKIIFSAAIVLMACGIAVISYPQAKRILYDMKVEEFIENELSSYQERELNDLYLRMQEYNREIYDSRQSGLVDPFSYEQTSFDLSQWGINENIAGYISIPAMDIKLPVYLGATHSNMKNGAVHLSQTSMPIGGENTNTVIAAHRGYYGARMFQDIQRLAQGDEVSITNFWETVNYRVTDIKVIAPSDMHEVLIQDGKEMVTLITCHPRRQNYQRYVVYCERVQ